MHVVRRGASAVHHSHDVKSRVAVELGMNKQAAEHLKIRHRYAQPAARFQRTIDMLERQGKFQIIAKMLKYVRGINLAAAFIRQEREITAVADEIDIRSRQYVEDFPSVALLAAANVKLDVFSRWRNTYVRGCCSRH